MFSPIITPAWSCSVSDNRARSGANQPARDRSAGRTASQAADKRATAATDQCTAQNAILPAVRTPAERQCHDNYDEYVTHLLLLNCSW
jgi:hypothetical protein